MTLANCSASSQNVSIAGEQGCEGAAKLSGVLILPVCPSLDSDGIQKLAEKEYIALTALLRTPRAPVQYCKKPGFSCQAMME